MEAGRELDAQIAALMGDRLIKRGKWRGYWDCGNGRHYSDQDGGPLHYSTDIAAAWLVVEEMRGRGWFFDLGDKPSDGDDLTSPRVWNAFVNRTTRGPDASTAPLAICLVALAARESP